MATLPNTRPTANTYGPDMEDDSAVVDPDLETPAATWNLMREDLAFCGQTSPLSVTSFNGTTAAVVTTRGGAMTCARLGAGGVLLVGRRLLLDVGRLGNHGRDGFDLHELERVPAGAERSARNCHEHHRAHFRRCVCSG